MWDVVTSALGGLFDNSADRKAAKKQREHEIHLAKNQIQYRVEDAKAAGLHPLYAMGGPTLSSNVSTPASNVGRDTANAFQNAMTRKYNEETRQKNLQLLDSQIELNKAQSMDYVAQAKKASDLSMVKNNLTNNHDDDIITSRKKMVVKTPLGDITIDGDYSSAEEAQTVLGGIAEEIQGAMLGGKAYQQHKFKKAWKANRARQREEKRIKNNPQYYFDKYERPYYNRVD